MEWKLPPYVLEALNALEKQGKRAYLIGGAVRDHLLGRPIHDYDVGTDATTEEIASAFQKEGIHAALLHHGTVLAHFGEKEVEVTPFRGDDPHSLESDLIHRDFTVNAIAYSPREGFLDPLGGREDLRQKLLRSYSPKESFGEDPLRILRGVRLEGELGFSLEPHTAVMMRKMAKQVLFSAPERIGEELAKILVLPRSDERIREHLPLFLLLFPELSPCVGFNQHSSHHQFDVLEHSLHALRFMKVRSAPCCYAALFHDVAKPRCFFLEGGEGHFYGHDKEGAKILRNVLTRYRYGKDFIEEACFLVEHHMFQIEKRKTLKRYLRDYGEKRMNELFALREADVRACSEGNSRAKKTPYLEALRRETVSILNEKAPLSLKDLSIHGDDLKAIGMAPGPRMGEILKELWEEVLDEKIPNEKKALLERAEELSRTFPVR